MAEGKDINVYQGYLRTYYLLALYMIIMWETFRVQIMHTKIWTCKEVNTLTIIMGWIGKNNYSTQLLYMSIYAAFEIILTGM